MCITNAKTDKPYNDFTIRWKVMFKSRNIPNWYTSMAAGTIWRVGVEQQSTDSSNLRANSDADIGFHVFVTREDARWYRKSQINCDLYIPVIVKMKVRQFIARGFANYSSTRCETWKYATVIEEVR